MCRKDTKASIVHRVLHFMIFNENESWYFEENVNTYSRQPNQANKDDLVFNLSNQMHGNVPWPPPHRPRREQMKVLLCNAQWLGDTTPQSWGVERRGPGPGGRELGLADHGASAVSQLLLCHRRPEGPVGGTEAIGCGWGPRRLPSGALASGLRVLFAQ